MGHIGQAVTLLEKNRPILRDQHRRAGRAVGEDAGEKRINQFVRRRHRGIRDGATASQQPHQLRVAAQVGSLVRRQTGFGLRIHIQALCQQFLDGSRIAGQHRADQLVGLQVLAQQPAGETPIALDILHLQQELILAGGELHRH